MTIETKTAVRVVGCERELDLNSHCIWTGWWGDQGVGR